MTEGERRERVALGAILPFVAIAMLTGWVCALLAASQAPWVNDLYNLVYHNSRPRKGESTSLFLFIFPLFLTVGFLGIVARSRGWRSRTPSRLPLELRLGGALVWTLFCFGASLLRSWLVYTHGY